ncbi:MAG: pentapeptide repeat-containing protein, partial [Thiobacillus sp.]|nr:pentapeptide repeat-containing protein [Thiobacillus sp.]
LASADFSGAKLEYSNMEGAILTGANLSRADLYESRFLFAELTNVNFIGANLHEADFSHAEVNGVATDATTTCPDLKPGPCDMHALSESGEQSGAARQPHFAGEGAAFRERPFRFVLTLYRE